MRTRSDMLLAPPFRAMLSCHALPDGAFRLRASVLFARRGATRRALLSPLLTQTPTPPRHRVPAAAYDAAMPRARRAKPAHPARHATSLPRDI